MNGVRFKLIPGDAVASALPISHLAPAGVRMLGALDALARRFQHDIVVTTTDGNHPPSDPHSLGEAFDVRTKGLPTTMGRSVLLQALLLELADPDESPAPVPGIALENLATRRFYGQIENPDADNEHLHIQRRNGTVYA